MNNITIAGNLGKDAELRTIPSSGDYVLSFSVADNQGKDKPTIWWNCQLFGKRAQSLQQYMTKGQQVAVSGSVSEREWTDQSGNTRKSMDIRVNDIALQGGRPSDERPTPAPARAVDRSPGQRARAQQNDDVDSDIPW